MFLGFGFWAYRPRNKPKMEYYGEYPVEGEPRWQNDNRQKERN